MFWDHISVKCNKPLTKQILCQPWFGIISARDDYRKWRHTSWKHCNFCQFMMTKGFHLPMPFIMTQSRTAGFPLVTFSATTFSTQKIFLVVLCNICNRYPLILILTGLKIYKENFCIGKLVAKKVSWRKPCLYFYKSEQRGIQRSSWWPLVAKVVDLVGEKEFSNRIIAQFTRVGLWKLGLSPKIFMF